ncbi:hypothetical protein GCM10010404_56970 [Nonomuraea africana]
MRIGITTEIAGQARVCGNAGCAGESGNCFMAGLTLLYDEGRRAIPAVFGGVPWRRMTRLLPWAVTLLGASGSPDADLRVNPAGGRGRGGAT